MIKEQMLPPVKSVLGLILLLALVGPALTFVVLPPALPLISLQFGGGEQGALIAQLTQALPFLGLSIGGLFAGWIIRTLGSRKLLLLASAIYCGSGLAGLFAESEAPLLAGCFGIGLTGALLSSGLVALTGTVVEEEHRPRMLGYQTAVSDLSTVTFGLVAASIAQSWGWHGPFLVYAAYGFLLLLLGGLSIPKAQSLAVNSEAGLFTTLRGGWPLYLGAGFVFLLTVTQTIQLPFHLAQHGLSTPTSRAIVLTCSTGAATLGALVFAVGYQRCGQRSLRVLATLSSASGFAGLAIWSGGLISASIAALFVGLGVGLTVPSLFASALRRAPPALRGYSIGLLNTSIFLGSFLSPVIFTPMIAMIGYSFAFLVAAGLTAAVGFFSLSLMK